MSEQGENKDDRGYVVQSASMPDREELVVELFFGSSLLAEFRFESISEGPRVQIFGGQAGFFDLELEVFRAGVNAAINRFERDFAPEFQQLAQKDSEP